MKDDPWTQAPAQVSLADQRLMEAISMIAGFSLLSQEQRDKLYQDLLAVNQRAVAQMRSQTYIIDEEP